MYTAILIANTNFYFSGTNEKFEEKKRYWKLYVCIFIVLKLHNNNNETKSNRKV